MIAGDSQAEQMPGTMGLGMDPALREAPYQAYFCEENAWQVARRALESGLDCEIWIISNAQARVAVWGQKLSSSPRMPVVWDYHVVVRVFGDGFGDQVVDPDARPSHPKDVLAWLTRSFPPGHEALLRDVGLLPPRFRVVSGMSYLERFASDRRHMLSDDGQYRHPAPPWQALSPSGPEVHNLDQLLDFGKEAHGPAAIQNASTREWPGLVFSLEQMRERLPKGLGQTSSA